MTWHLIFPRTTLATQFILRATRTNHQEVINLPTNNSNNGDLTEMRKDIEALHHDLHEVKNAVRWLPELLDILEIDGRTLADILQEVKELKEKSESDAAPGSGAAPIVVRPAARLRVVSPKKMFGNIGGGSRKSGTRRTGSDTRKGGSGWRSSRKR